MTISYTTAVRNARLSAISAAVDAGAAGGRLNIYSGARPSTGGTATTLLAQLTFATTAFGAPASGVLTANAITKDADADTTGTASWFRVTDSNGLFVLDGDVGVTGSGKDLELNSVAIGAGQEVEITAFVITEGNS